MRTLLFSAMRSESRFCDPQAIAAKVRHLDSSAGLRLIEFSTEGEERAVLTLKLLAILSLGSARVSGLRAAEAKENRKIPWNALLSRRMLAHGSVRSNE